MEIEGIQLDMQKRLLDVQSALKSCTPPIELSFKPINNNRKNGRFHYTIRHVSHGKQQCQTRLSALSFDTLEQAESLKSKLMYAEQLLSSQTETRVLKVGTPVLKEFNNKPFYGDVTCIKNNLYHVVYDDEDGKNSI